LTYSHAIGDTTLNIVCPVSVLIGSQFNIGSGAVGIIGLFSTTSGGTGDAPLGRGGGGGAEGIAGGSGGGGGTGILGEAGRGVVSRISFGIVMSVAVSSVIPDLTSSNFFCIIS